MQVPSLMEVVYSPAAIWALLATLVFALGAALEMLFSKRWDPRGKVSIRCNTRWPILTNLIARQHCLVTGGSSGAGLSIAKVLVQNGAHVSIVGRNQEKLKRALGELEVSSLLARPAEV